MNPVTPNIINALDFISNLHDQSLSYIAMNSTKMCFLTYHLHNTVHKTF